MVRNNEKCLWMNPLKVNRDWKNSIDVWVNMGWWSVETIISVYFICKKITPNSNQNAS